LILEIKWNAPQSAYDEEGRIQLARQWIAVKSSAGEDIEIKQTYLTLTLSEARAGLKDTQESNLITGSDLQL
jgi:hypothetical protein